MYRTKQGSQHTEGKKPQNYAYGRALVKNSLNRFSREQWWECHRSSVLQFSSLCIQQKSWGSTHFKLNLLFWFQSCIFLISAFSGLKNAWAKDLLYWPPQSMDQLYLLSAHLWNISDLPTLHQHKQHRMSAKITLLLNPPTQFLCWHNIGMVP